MSALQSFFTQGKVLVIDSNLASRVAVRQSLMELGAPSNRITCVKSVADARRAIESGGVTLVIADYELDDGLATNIFTHSRDFLFLLLSSNNSRAAVAKAAEDEVDEFLFKPYNQEDFKNALEQMVDGWLNPNDSERALADGKAWLEQGEADRAAECFERAKRDPKTNAKACSYLAQIQKSKVDYAGAEKLYEEGLDSNQLHFRCLNGLFQTYYQQNRLEDAYRILKEIVMNFPESPERLSTAVYLAVKTQHLKDVEIYFGVFDLMTQKTPDTIRHLSSALAVAGQYHLRRKNMIQAMLSFERALAISTADPKYVEYISGKLRGLGLTRECQRLLSQFGLSSTSGDAA